MLSLNQYITENLLVSANMICEKNHVIFPTKEKYGPFTIMVGDHVDQRESERHVTDKEIVNAIFGAKKDLEKMYADGKIKQSSKDFIDTFVIVDCRKSTNRPLSVVGFIAKSRKPNTLKHSLLIIKTVFKGADFSAATRQDSEKEHHIFLY